MWSGENPLRFHLTADRRLHHLLVLPLQIMTDAQVKRKMKQIAKLCDELDVEAKQRYGREGFLFFEAEGYFQIMDGDTEGHGRQDHIRVKSDDRCSLQAGAW